VSVWSRTPPPLNNVRLNFAVLRGRVTQANRYELSGKGYALSLPLLNHARGVSPWITLKTFMTSTLVNRFGRGVIARAAYSRPLPSIADVA
jgi:hypothetical protein